MATVLVFNPGSNSLKFEIIDCATYQQVAAKAEKLVSAALDGVGQKPKLSVYDGRKVIREEDSEARDMTTATRAAIDWLRKNEAIDSALERLSIVEIRVVHGGPIYAGAVRVSEKVRTDIEALEDLAPLHNQSSLDVLSVLEQELPHIPVFVTFDTAFHRTIPEKAWRYPIERVTADRYGVRKFGFHGVSHRYMLDQYAFTVGKQTEEISIVSLHLERGSSACAIQAGKSVDTTMGLTPLEGLMTGSRSGSIDPAIVPFLMRKENQNGDEILEMLNKKSGILGIAGGSLDTRVLAKRGDNAAKLALEMFSYRVRLAVGAYLAALGNAEAVLFGGGIGEDSPWLREEVCAGLGSWGLEIDTEANKSTAGMQRITTDRSKLHAWAMPVEEGLQIAHECVKAFLSAQN